MSDSDHHGNLSDKDLAFIEEDLGRTPRGAVGVAARCKCGRPLVVTTAPRLPDGSPFPTMFYMSSPILASACSKLEAEHVMVAYNELLGADEDLSTAYVSAHTDYLERRRALGDAVGVGDVEEISEFSAGGMPTRVKCLHALVAHSLAAGPGVNPIGDLALEELATRGMWDQAVCCCAN